MLYYTHLLLSIVIFVLLKIFVPTFLSGGNPFFFFFLFLFTSILPDIDEYNSKVNRWSGILGILIAFFFKHRGFFHALWLYLISSAVIFYFFSPYYALAFLLGYISHLLGDVMTPMGIQIFYPFSSFHLRGPIKVGGILEIILISLLLLLLVWLLFTGKII